MRIGINGRFLVAKRTGVQRAAFNLIKTLVKVDVNNEYYLFTGEKEQDKPEWAQDNVKVIPSRLREGEALRNHFWEQVTLPFLAKKFRVDILHSPANLAPLFYRGASIVHIHDLCFVVNPQWYSYSFHTAYNFLIPRLAKRASRIITNSNNSRNDLLQFCKLEPNKLALIYWAVDSIFSAPSLSPSSINLPPNDYILYVGSLEPRKNIGILIDAYEKLRIACPKLETNLVIIGADNPLFANLRLRDSLFKKDILFKGFVSDKDLREYYKNASVVAYPSLYEGFGLPPLEAMAAGVPVVTSNNSSLPEVVGDAAIMVNPYCSDELSNAIHRVISDKNLQTELRSKGRKRAKMFNWHRVAREVLGVYHEVYDEAYGGNQRRYLPLKQWKELVEKEREEEERMSIYH